MALQKSVVSSHHEYCSLLCFLLLRKQMLKREKNNKDARLSDFASFERES